MNIDAGLSIVVSFLGFGWIFMKKIYPHITKQLDDHIELVKKKIQEAENFKNEAYVSLRNAYTRKDDTEEIIRINRLKSEEKIKKLQEENKKLLKMLRERHAASLKIQLDAELVKQKNLLIERLSDLILEKMSKKVADPKCKVSTPINAEDLRKLLGIHNN